MIEVPNIGTCILVAVYIPPVQQGYIAYKFSDICDELMESVRDLQLAQKVPKDNVLIIRDSNAHVEAQWGGTLSEQVGIELLHSNYSGFWLTLSQFSQCSQDMGQRGASLNC